MWFHRRKGFDTAASCEEVVDEYALPGSDAYTVRIVEVPAGEEMRIGDIAGTADRSGGADLVGLRSGNSIPGKWVTEETGAHVRNLILGSPKIRNAFGILGEPK